MDGTGLDCAANDAIGRLFKNAEVAAVPSALLDRQCRATLRRQDARRAASALTLQLVRSKDIIAALLRLAYYYVGIVLSHRRYPTDDACARPAA